MSPDSNPEISALRKQVFIQLIALVVIAGTLTGYLYRQASAVGKQITQAQQIITAYQQNQPTFNNFINELVAYGEKHPDFTQQVLKKWGIAPIPGVPAGSPAPMPKK
ncbi:MAG TPA: hypothetical protein VGO57_07015 [Verrucomicrobiae bacterium]|jgi:hypothetical protein